MKARIISVQIIPQIVVDDGENLLPQQVQPMIVLWRDWSQFSANGLQDALEKLQEQLDSADALNKTLDRVVKRERDTQDGGTHE